MLKFVCVVKFCQNLFGGTKGTPYKYLLRGGIEPTIHSAAVGRSTIVSTVINMMKRCALSGMVDARVKPRACEPREEYQG